MKKGDTVSVLDDVLTGQVVRVLNDEVTIRTTDGFELNFHRNELVVIDGTIKSKELFNKDLRSVLSEKETTKRKKSTRIKPKDRSAPPMEVDLHIHQLVKNEKGLNNYDMLNIQMDTAKRQLEFAINKRIQRVVFVHGVGEGVLKTELEFLFRRYDNVKYYDADYKKYGRGATEVYIFQNASN